MSSTQTQYTVKVPLNPLSLPTTDKTVIWDASEGKFNLGNNSDCVRWVYNTGTTASGISQYQVRFNNSSITSATEIYIHKDSINGSNDWSDYFIKLIKFLCCTLTVRLPGESDEYIVFDYDSSGSTFDGTYLKFSVSDLIAAPLVTDSNFTISNGDNLCLDFDLFKCTEKGIAEGTGDTENYACRQYWQYADISLNAVTSVSDEDINDFSFANGNGQFVIGLTGGTSGVYTLSTGDTVYVRMTQANYWGENLNALGIQTNNQIILSQYNSNNTQTTGEQLVLNTTDVLYQYAPNIGTLSSGYIVFEATIESITSGLSSGIPNDSTYCFDVTNIPTPETDFSKCDAVFVHGIFDGNGNSAINSPFVTQLGDIISVGEDIGNFGGAGLADTNISGSSLCADQSYTFVFAATDALDNNVYAFLDGLGSNNVIRYELLYTSAYNAQGNFLLLEIVNKTYLTDASNNPYFEFIVNILEDSDFNCNAFFKDPRNLVCLTRQTQTTPAPLPLDGEGYIGYIGSTTISGATAVSGSTAVDNTDITQIGEIILAGLDSNRNSWVDDFSANTMYSINIHYKTSSIEYEVTSTKYTTTGIGKLQVNLGRILKNGFESKTSLQNNSKVLTEKQGIVYFFNFETIPNQSDGRVITSTGSGDGLQAEENLTFKNNQLTVSGDTFLYGELYQQSVETDITTNGNHNIISIPTSSGSTFEYTYFVQEDTTGGFRAGKVLGAVNSSGTVTTFTDTSTADGTSTTEDIEFSTVISGSNLILRATTTNSTTWNIKVKVEVLF